MSEDLNDKSSKKPAESASSTTAKTGTKATAAKSTTAESSSTKSGAGAAGSTSSTTSTGSGAKSSSSSTTARASGSTASPAAAAGSGSSSTGTGSSSAGASSPSSSSSSLDTGVGGSGQPTHVASGVSYVLGPISGLLFLLLDRRDPVVRFHASQALVISALIAVGWLVVKILSTTLAAIPLVFWVGFGCLIYLAVTAFQSKKWDIPFLSDYAQRLADKLAPEDEGGKKS